MLGILANSFMTASRVDGFTYPNPSESAARAAPGLWERLAGGW